MYTFLPWGCSLFEDQILLNHGNEILRLAAGLSALVFAIHPLGVEPVAWASARSEILATLFSLCSVLSYLQAVRMDEPNRRRAQWMTLSVFTYCLSLLSGMSGIALPGVLLVLDVYPLGRFAGAGNWLSPEAGRLYKEKIPYLLIALVGFVVALIASNAESFVGETFGEPAMTEIALVPRRSGFSFLESVCTVRFVSRLRAAGMGSGLKRVRFPSSQYLALFHPQTLAGVAGDLDLLLNASLAHSQQSFSWLGNVGRSPRLFVLHSLGGFDRCCRDGLLAGLCEWSYQTLAFVCGRRSERDDFVWAGRSNLGSDAAMA